MLQRADGCAYLIRKGGGAASSPRLKSGASAACNSVNSTYAFARLLVRATQLIGQTIIEFHRIQSCQDDLFAWILQGQYGARCLAVALPEAQGLKIGNPVRDHGHILYVAKEASVEWCDLILTLTWLASDTTVLRFLPQPVLEQVPSFIRGAVQDLRSQLLLDARET